MEEEEERTKGTTVGEAEAEAAAGYLGGRPDWKKDGHHPAEIMRDLKR